MTSVKEGIKPFCGKTKAPVITTDAVRLIIMDSLGMRHFVD